MVVAAAGDVVAFSGQQIGTLISHRLFTFYAS